MDTKLLQLCKMFFYKSVEEIFVQSCLHVYAHSMFGAGGASFSGRRILTFVKMSTEIATNEI